MAPFDQPIPPVIEELIKPRDTEKENCLNGGGLWDEATRTCQTPIQPSRKPVVEQNDPIIKLPDGTEQIQTPEMLAAEKLDIDRTNAAKGGIGGREAGEIKERTDAIEAERQELLANDPVRRELDPVTNVLETIAPVGALLNNLQLAIKDRVPFLRDKLLTDVRFEITPEELRTAALTEIERQEIERGLTQSEKFGRFAESLTIGQFSKWVPGISSAEKPSGNVQEILKSLRQLKTRARDIDSRVSSGRLTRAQAEERIRMVENELQAGESRMRLLIQNSPELKFNSDGVNFIEGKVLETRIILQDARASAITGQIKDAQTSDAELLQQMTAIENEDYGIPGLQ